MSKRRNPTTLSSLRPLAAFCAVMAAAFLPGCGTQGDNNITQSGAIDTGTFPNLNIPPKTAAAQLTRQEQAQKLAALRASKSGQGAAPVNTNGTAANAALLKKLAAHGDDTLKEIEQN